MRKNSDKNRGFTLVEVLLVLVVIAVLFTFAVPLYASILKKSWLRTATNEWRSSYYYAQNIAMTTKSVVSFCASKDGLTCNSDNFKDGWIICARCSASDPTNDVFIYLDSSPPPNYHDISMVLEGGSGILSGQIAFLKNGDVKGAVGRRLRAHLVKNKEINTMILISAGGRLTTKLGD